MKKYLLIVVLLASCEDIEHFTDPPKREEPKEISVPPIPQDTAQQTLERALREKD